MTLNVHGKGKVVLHVSVYKRGRGLEQMGRGTIYTVQCLYLASSPGLSLHPGHCTCVKNHALIARDLLSSRTAGSSRVARGHC